MIQRPRSLLRGTEPTPGLLRGVIDEFRRGHERLSRLKQYYLAENDILSRAARPALPNVRLPHAFARYIVTVSTGYLVGESVGYRAREEDADALDRVLQAYKRMNAPAVDVENARNASIYGRGVEIVTSLPGERLPRSFALSPESAFVVYDDTPACQPLFGVYLSRAAKEDGSPGPLSARVYTSKTASRWELKGKGFEIMESVPHFFERVPMVEYWNDEHEKGDFEWVLPLIDAYDLLQSDRVNDKQQAAEKLLVLTGCALDTDEQGRPPWLQLRMDKALCLPDGDAKAEYLSGHMDENGNEILKESLSRDIQKLSLVPDLSEKSFAGNLSGIALKYRLLGLEQLCFVKQQWFTEGLKTRLKLFARALQVWDGVTFDAGNVEVSFTRSLPENLNDTAELIKAASQAGAMSTRTMVETLHRTADWDEKEVESESEMIQSETADDESAAEKGGKHERRT
ncbi:MAG: phage portal protein [Clostridia bacterium]|nr:phage portal protein [Clostridia bacterium]